MKGGNHMYTLLLCPLISVLGRKYPCPGPWSQKCSTRASATIHVSIYKWDQEVKLRLTLNIWLLRYASNCWKTNAVCCGEYLFILLIYSICIPHPLATKATRLLCHKIQRDSNHKISHKPWEELFNSKGCSRAERIPSESRGLSTRSF